MSKSPQMIFVNLPVTDLSRSTAFYEAAGFTINPQFSNEGAACMVLSDTIMVMLLTPAKWAQFTSRKIADAKKTAQVLLCITRDSKDAVNSIVAAAAKHGGTADPNPTQDLGFMFGRSFEDPDGHIWEAVWMDMPAPMEKSS